MVIKISSKTTLVYCNTKLLFLHLYYCFKKGYELQITVGDMKTPHVLNLSKEEAEEIAEQFGK